MKSVLISIQPKWCELIASGKKTIEVRKTRPKIETPFKVYIYCTKPKGKYDYGLCIDRGVCGTLKSVGLLAKCNYEFAVKNEMPILSGKVIGEFVCDKIYPIRVESDIAVVNWSYFGLKRSCLSLDEVAKYIGINKTGYGWHISDLVIYDKPKELSEFHKVGYTETKESVSWLTREEENSWQITRPPQSWCYVERKED